MAGSQVHDGNFLWLCTCVQIRIINANTHYKKVHKVQGHDPDSISLLVQGGRANTHYWTNTHYNRFFTRSLNTDSHLWSLTLRTVTEENSSLCINGSYLIRVIRQYSSCYYRPQTKLRKDNVFTSVCQKFCPRGGVHPPEQNPVGRHPLGKHPPGRHPLIRWPL